MITIIILSLAVVFLSALAMYYRDALEKTRKELAESKAWSDNWCNLARQSGHDLREANSEICRLRSLQNKAQ